AGGGVRAGDVDLGLADAVGAEELLRAHRRAEELEDGVSALERPRPAAVGRHSVGDEALGDLIPPLLVEAAHVLVLEALDLLDGDQVVDRDRHALVHSSLFSQSSAPSSGVATLLGSFSLQSS